MIKATILYALFVIWLVKFAQVTLVTVLLVKQGIIKMGYKINVEQHVH